MPRPSGVKFCLGCASKSQLQQDKLKLKRQLKGGSKASENDLKELKSCVSKLGYTFRADVPGDGNCMFHAVSDQVLRTEGRRIGHEQLREQTVEHLRKNPYTYISDGRNITAGRRVHLKNFMSNGLTWEKYLERMSRDGTWGDHIVLQAMADMLGHDVIIVSSGKRADNYVTTLSSQSKPVGRPLLLGHRPEKHYYSLDDQESPHPAPLIEIIKPPEADREVVVPDNLERWNHIRGKGCFYFKAESIISHEYKLDLPHASNVWITVQPLYLHREDKDEPVENPVDTTLVVLRDGDRDSFIQFTDIRDGEKYCLRCDLRSGSYRLLPFTTGCRLRKRKSQPKQEAPLVVTKSGEIELSRPFRNTLTDIFEVLDLDGNGLLSREEFNLFQVRTSGEEVDDEAWDFVEENFEMKKGELTRKGFTFLNLMEAQGSEGDTEQLWKALSSMGYNKALRQDEACPFVIDIYAEECKPKMVLEGLLEDNEDVEDAMCKFISSKGESTETEGGRDLVLYTYSTDSRISTAVENKAGRKAAVQLDCSRSKNCSSHRDDLDYTAEVPPRKTTIGHHILPSNDRQEWIYRCMGSVL